MPVFEIKTKERLNVNGEFVDKGLSVQVSTVSSNPFDEIEKIHNAFMRVYGLDLKITGYLNQGYLDSNKV